MILTAAPKARSSVHRALETADNETGSALASDRMLGSGRYSMSSIANYLQKPLPTPCAVAYLLGLTTISSCLVVVSGWVCWLNIAH